MPVLIVFKSVISDYDSMAYLELPDSIERPAKKLRVLTELLGTSGSGADAPIDLTGLAYLLEDILAELAEGVRGDR
jgi:hypothetical protein